MYKSVTILGCGRTAQAMCAYLAEKNVPVTIWGKNTETIEAISKNGISVTGCREGNYRPITTTNLAEAVESSELLIVMTTSNGHLPIAKALKGLLKSKQCILIFNGNWGAYEFFTELEKEIKQKEIILAETGSMIFLADYVDDTVHIKSIKNEISVASIPKESISDFIGECKDLFPQFVPERNIASTSINNSNPVIHVPISLFNISRIENGEDYTFYGKAASRSIIDYIVQIDKERCNVAKRIGANPKTCLEIINSFWPQKYDNLFDALKNNSSYQTGKGPRTLDHRYICEDIPYGIAPIAALGRQYDIETPYIDALLTIAEGLFPKHTSNALDFTVVDLHTIC